MVSKLRLAKGIMKISTTLKIFLRKCSKVANHLKEVTKTKDEGLFSTLIDTF